MAESKVMLHAAWGSPFSQRVEIALKMKGIEYVHIEEDIINDNKSPELLRYNPVYKKIPVLVHGTQAIAESQVILEYIDETWDSGAPILPKNPYHRAAARFWARFIDDKVLQSIYNALILEEEQAMKDCIDNMKILDNELQGKRFFGGESPGFVDIVANAVGYWVELFEAAAGKVFLTDEAFPWVCKWRKEFLSCGLLCESLPVPKKKLVAVFKDRIHTLKAKTSN